MKKGFDNKKYIKIQSNKIKERFKLFDKLYLEIGGKLFDDYHAARVLPGFEPDAKINMFKELKNDVLDEEIESLFSKITRNIASINDAIRYKR